MNVPRTLGIEAYKNYSSANPKTGDEAAYNSTTSRHICVSQPQKTEEKKDQNSKLNTENTKNIVTPKTKKQAKIQEKTTANQKDYNILFTNYNLDQVPAYCSSIEKDIPRTEIQVTNTDSGPNRGRKYTKNEVLKPVPTKSIEMLPFDDPQDENIFGEKQEPTSHAHRDAKTSNKQHQKIDLKTKLKMLQKQNMAKINQKKDVSPYLEEKIDEKKEVNPALEVKNMMVETSKTCQAGGDEKEDALQYVNQNFNFYS